MCSLRAVGKAVVGKVALEVDSANVVRAADLVKAVALAVVAPAPE